MAINKTLKSSSLGIEIQNGTDKSGDPTYTKKTFSNVRTDAPVDNVYAVAEAVKGVLSVGTRDYFLDEISTLDQQP